MVAKTFDYRVRALEAAASWESLEQAVGETLGAASVCWERIEDAGIFQSDQAKVLVDVLVDWIVAQRQAAPDAPPPEAFTLPVVTCPACGHGIDSHSPTDTCGVGDATGKLCACRWGPNDIAASRLLHRP